MRRIDQRRGSDGGATRAAAVLLGTLALAACGGAAGTEQAEEGTAVNAVEAMLAIDDVRVAGVPLASLPATDGSTLAELTRGGAARQADGAPPDAAADPAASAAASGPAAVSPPAGGRPATARRPASRDAPRPLAHLALGDPLVVDMEVADSPAGSQVTVAWFAADGRPVWRQRREVGERPRLAFPADTARWKPGLYRGEVRYGEETLHRFAVQVGPLAPQTIADDRGTTLPGRPAAGVVAATGAPPAEGPAGAAPSGAAREPATSAPSGAAREPSPTAPAGSPAAPAGPSRPAPASPEPSPAEPAPPSPSEPAAEPAEQPAPGAPPEEPEPAPPPAEPPPQPPPEEPDDDPPRRELVEL